MSQWRKLTQLSPSLAQWPGSGILDAYEGNAAAQLDQALGFYLTAWAVVTFIFLLASLRSSVGLVSVFFFLVITFVLLAAVSTARSVLLVDAVQIIWTNVFSYNSMPSPVWPM